ncbi:MULTISPECIES: thiamine pyrophosphate-dependent dehydrogenase E1 component subunit alpha [Kordiimonas]|jgi:pyruvate dehydrogenase E1 component alpha subunit|uniref:thiamine pyrophosphate-dependent dehydrogenase E1 component subunit alpha n=1 Tax=Kordiimonas TaxID=288021 RepID=UPI00257A06C8|nr:thiamine pyrophosphate-dependent dehydrogenase E1 component subunit alpha [Kordiimonas sp. UBA4487]
MELEDLTLMFEKAHFIRAFEGALAAASDAGEVPGLVHLSNGAEILELAVASALDLPKDQVTGSHRSHGIALSLGVDPLALACEILGREGGLSEGLGGTQHLIAPESGLLGSNGIVGGQVPLALGAALSAKTLKTGGIAVSYFGDGAANQGAVLESLNLAVVLKLPVLFVCENNGFGQSTASAYAAGGTSLLGRARAFGLAADHVDGTDPLEATKTAHRLAAWVRDTGSPAFLEASVPRLSGHYHGDTERYRTTDGRSTDPLDRLEGMILSRDVPEGLVDGMKSRAHADALAIVDEATAAPDASDTALEAFMAEAQA